MVVIFKTIRNQAGAEVVLPLPHRQAEHLKRLEAQLAETTDDGQKKVLASILAKTKELGEELGRRDDLIDRRFEITPYTRGQRRKAQSEATRWENGQPVIDQAQYQELLVRAATGMSADTLDALPPTVYDALAFEVLSLCEPTVDQIRFFDSSPTS